jgi:N-acylneuraminate cytidylyltransferase
MVKPPGVLAVIPARGGSKGLPGKNVRPFAGLPLIAHSILFAKMCPEIAACVVSTDSPEIAEIARRYGADVPFLRPAALAADDTPLWPVIRHALAEIDAGEPRRFDAVLLLDPTSPGRAPADVAGARAMLSAAPGADGVVGASRPDFNPLWNCVVQRDGWMAQLVEEGAGYERRQDVPVVYRINGSLYLWRADFVRDEAGTWRRSRKHLLYELPESRAMSIDTLEEFERAELLVREGFITLPWMQQAGAGR